MPTSLPMPTKAVGDIFTTTLWNNNLRDNLNKLLNTGHRVLTVAQFAALGAPEGTKGTVAPDEVYLEVDATNGIQWHLAYESGETTYKWRFIGGPPMYSEVFASESTASAAYAALATAGPSIALPRAGDYDVRVEARIFGPESAAVGSIASMSYDIGGTGAVANDGAINMNAINSVTDVGASVAAMRRKTGLTAVTLTAKYSTNSTTTTFFNARRLVVTPVRII